MKEVANFKEPQGVEQGKYELKDEYYPKINRYAPINARGVN